MRLCGQVQFLSYTRDAVGFAWGGGGGVKERGREWRGVRDCMRGVVLGVKKKDRGEGEEMKERRRRRWVLG